MGHFSKEEIEEIVRRLATYGKKDTEFETASDPSDDDIVAIVQDFENKKISLADIRRYFGAPYLPLDGSSAMEGDLDMGDHNIENVANPSLSHHAANKDYVDGVASELDSEISNIDGRVQGIEDVIPSSVDPDTNQLADKAWVKAVNDLVNYYKKSETYTQAEVNALIAAIDQFHYEIYPSLSSITDPQGNVLYLIGPKSGTSGDQYEEYVYSDGSFTKIGDTSIDLSGYMPKSGGTFTGDVNIYKSDLYVRGQISVECGEILMSDPPVSDMAAINKGYVDDGLSGKQDTLVSGTNIKTVNSTSLLGSGDIQISADTSDCVKFGETINANNYYLKINGTGVPFSLMLVVTMDYYTSEYLVNGSEQSVKIVKMNGEQSFDGMLRIDDDTYYPIALYHEDSIAVTPILLSGTMPTITDSASASGDDEEIPMFQTKKELPSGGTAGQVLTKASGTDYDVEWADGSEVFWATYGTTTASEIDTAVAAGKIALCSYNDFTYVIVNNNNTDILFGAAVSNTNYYLRLVRSNNTWTNTIAYLQASTERVNTLSGNETANNRYPTTKAVADALGKMGVISQTQTWSGTGSNPRTYVMSNLVTGLIPQANIDLFEAAGAVFNELTGYFELNGLTDISYEEMKVIYWIPVLSQEMSTRYLSSKIRTTLSQMGRADASNGGAQFVMGNSFNTSSIEVVSLVYSHNSGVRCKGMGNTFFRAYYLRKILDVLHLELDNPYMSNDFGQCYSLEYVHIKSNGKNILLPDSSLLAEESLLYMINNAGTNAFTITLHASVYDKCQSGGDWYSDISTALAAHTNVSLASA